MKSFRKYFWQLVTTILALLAIFAAYNIFFLGQPRKELQIIIDTPISLVDVKPEAVPDIQVSYKGEPVNKVFLLQVHIKNSGNQPIAEADFNRPLSFIFPPEYKLADATITSSEPANIGMTVTKTSEQVAQASRTLLNQDDLVSVRFIVIGDSSETLLNKFTIDGRILGIKEIKRISSSDQQTPEWWLAVLGVLFSLGANILASLSSLALDFFKRFKKSTQKTDNSGKIE
jgi:hypothetical protein